MYPLDFWTALPIFLAAPAQVLFLIIYSVPYLGAGEWWKSFVGRALFIKTFTITFLILAAVISYLVHAHLDYYTGINWDFTPTHGVKSDRLVTIGYWFVCIAIYYQNVAIVRQRVVSAKNHD